MANIHDEPAALKALQDDIYRERVLRARKMTVAERMADVFELSNHQFGMMLAGAPCIVSALAMRRLEVKHWVQRLDRVREIGLYSTEKPLTNDSGS